MEDEIRTTTYYMIVCKDKCPNCNAELQAWVKAESEDKE